MHPLDTIGVYTVAMAAMWLAALVPTGPAWAGGGHCSPRIGHPPPLLACPRDHGAGGRPAYPAFWDIRRRRGRRGRDTRADQHACVPAGPGDRVRDGLLIRSSQGRRSIGLVNGSIIIALSFMGVLGTTRVAILGPFITYLLTCVAFRFRFRVSHFVFFGVLLLVAQRLLFPLALIGRNIAHNSKVGLLANWGASFNLLVEAIEDPDLDPECRAEGRQAAPHLSLL